MVAASPPLVLINKFVPVNYKLDIDIVPSKPNFQGELEIDLISNANYTELEDAEDGDLSLTFNSANIIVTSASFVNEANQVKADVKYDRSAETVTFTTKDYGFNDLSSLKIYLKYMGKITNIKTYQDSTTGVFKTNYLNGLTGKADNYIIATHCQPKFARLIFPCVDELTSKPTFELSIKTDIRYTCICNSPVKEVVIVDDVKKIVKFSKSPPMTPSIFGFVVGDLEYVEQLVKLGNSREVPIRVYTPIGELENASYPLNVAALALPEVESMIHHPYPLEKLDFVALPFLSDSAMEDWGLIQVQQSYLLIEPEYINQKEFEAQVRNLREVIVHEIIHQWIGNLITFDDWAHLWLNEAFATFAAYAVLIKLNLNAKDKLIWEEKCATDFQKMMDNDSLHNSKPIFVKHSLEVKNTQDALDQNSYYKGIPLLRMLGNLLSEKSNDDFENFFQIVGSFLDSWKFKTFKPVDLWNFITNSSLNSNKVDVATFMHSWTRLPGHPILYVTVNGEGTINVTQHRYIYDIKIEDDTEFEDVPYHIPLTCKLSDGTLARQFLNDRKKDLNLDPKKLLSINANYSNIAKVKYCSAIYSNIAAGIKANAFNPLDLLSFTCDLNRILGQPFQTDEDLIGLLEIAEAYAASTTVIDFTSLDMVLNMVQNLASSVELINSDSNLKIINKLNQWLGKVIVSLKNKLLWDVSQFDYSKASFQELRARNSILATGAKLSPEEFQPVIKKLYKNLTHGPKQSIPKELLNSILSATLSNSNQQKEYKEILALAKSPTLTINNIIKDGTSDSDIRGVLQTSAVLSLGYVSQPDLVLKTLNFVMTNVDSKLIELALIGLALQPKLRQQLWDWYVLHYNGWCLKTYRDGSAYSKQLKATLTNISKIIFSMMINNAKNSKKVNAFVEEKMNSSLYQKFDVREILENVKMENEEKVKLGAHNDTVLAWLESH